MPLATLTRLAAAAATATVLLLTGTGVAGAAGSADLLNGLGSTVNNPDLTATATKAHGNLSVTREIIGKNTGHAGETLTYRTTVSAADGPARNVTRIKELIEKPHNGTYLTEVSGKLTYTDATGARVTDALRPSGIGTVTGSWPVDAATGATVVHETTYQWNDPNVGLGPKPPCSGECPPVDPAALNSSVSVDVTGLATLDWNPTGVLASCTFDCSNLWPLAPVLGPFSMLTSQS
ncbi:hypothetical protein [Rhodococcus tukisamuensis]|uniref:Uncharacterized protein n=1 Tax=Rhodococcus tukisamuensis TaxID=168276 RepID=A0A1G6YJZ0_9NOCA|nr:hypothetical protein [Rhodococcus tukisamuensis]SDD89955.1 hypothetical protein SAMN05444580_107189 [Rhodococcus tukisamuensis]